MTAERKRLTVLIGILAVLGGYSLYTNVLSGPSASAPSRPAGAAHLNSATPPGPGPLAAAPAATQSIAMRATEEFHPSLKPRRPEDRVDPRSIDPTLRLDLLAKVQGVDMQGVGRNLFQFSAPPPPPLPPEPKVPVKVAKSLDPRAGLPGARPAAPGAPQAPFITFKYYGYSTARGDNRKRAFFLDGDEILVAGEGETVVTAVKRRYRVVRIGVNSVEMEDAEFKSRQTLQLQEEAAG